MTPVLDRRIEKEATWFGPQGRFYLLLFVVFIVLAFIGTEPLNDRVRIDIRNVEASGDAFRQFFVLLTAAFLILSARRSYREVFSIASHGHWLLVFWILLTIIWSPDPFTSFRRSALTILSFGTVLLFTVQFGYKRTTTLIAIILSSLCIFSLLAGIITPNAIHRSGEPSEIVGAWRGLFPHKNNAGFAAMIAVILSLREYLTTSRKKLWMLLIAFDFIFLWMTESKTSIAITILAIISTGMVFALSTSAKSAIYVKAISIYTIMVITVIMVVFWADIQTFLSDPSQLTNRVYIWQIVASVWERNFMFGIGFGNLWEVSPEYNLMLPLLSGDLLAANQGHNGYLDIGATTGLIGLSLSVAVIFGLPLLLLFSMNTDKNDASYYSTFLILILLLVIYNFMESSILRNFQPTWVVLAFCHVAVLEMYRSRTRRVARPADQERLSTVGIK